MLSFKKRSKAASVGEMGLLAGLVAVVLISSVSNVGEGVKALFGGTSNAIERDVLGYLPEGETEVTIGEIADQSHSFHTVSYELPLPIQSSYYALGALNVSVTSSDETAFPQNGIQVTFKEGQWVAQITPTGGVAGVTVLTVTVATKTGIETATFNAEIREQTAAPAIVLSKKNMTIPEGELSNMTFTISDADTPLNELTPIATPLDADIFPTGSYDIIGADAGYYFSFTPAKPGTTAFVISVGDGDNVTNEVLTLTSTFVDDAPIITDNIPARIEETSATYQVTVFDEDTELDSLTHSVTVSGANYTLDSFIETAEEGVYDLTLSQSAPSTEITIDISVSFSDSANTTTINRELVVANAGAIIYKSCKEILENGQSTGSGNYVIDPDGTGSSYGEIVVYCDMSTDGGGWTRMTKALARNSFGGDLVGYQLAVEGFTGDSPRAYKPAVPGTNENYMNVHYNFDVPYGYNEFFLSSDYKTRIYIPVSSSNTWDWGYDLNIISSNWATAQKSGYYNGYVAFGSSSAAGPAVHSVRGSSILEQTNGKTRSMPFNGQIFNVGSSSGFKIVFSEGGTQEEGLEPWYSGYIYFR